MRWFPYELTEETLALIDENLRSKVKRCLEAIFAMRVSRGQLEADIKHGYFSLAASGGRNLVDEHIADTDTIVVYYRPIECELEKYDTRDALAKYCRCSCDLDYMADPEWSNYLSAAFYNWNDEPLDSMGLF